MAKLCKASRPDSTFWQLALVMIGNVMLRLLRDDNSPLAKGTCR